MWWDKDRNRARTEIGILGQVCQNRGWNSWLENKHVEIKPSVVSSDCFISNTSMYLFCMYCMSISVFHIHDWRMDINEVH